MKKMSPRVYSFFIGFLFTCASFNITPAFSQIVSFHEQQEISPQDKERLLHFYWRISKQLMIEGQYDEALSQAYRIKEIDPTNAEVDSFIERVHQRKKTSTSVYDRIVRSNTFIREQELYSRGDRTPGGVTAVDESVIPSGISKEMIAPVKSTMKEIKPMSMLPSKKSPASKTTQLKPMPQAIGQKVSYDEKKQVAQSIKKAQKAYASKAYDDALFSLNEVLILDPRNETALALKADVLRDRRKNYRNKYQSQREKKAALLREEIIDEEMFYDEDDLSDIEESENIRLKAEKQRLREIERRSDKAEEKLREDLRERIAAEEKENLDLIIKEVEDSKFYEKFDQYQKEKENKELLRTRQIHSFLLRADGLMEMKQYEEAAVYLNNVFMVDPYNERAQKMRERLERALMKKEINNQREADEMFEKEKSEYVRIREKVKKEKISELLAESKRLYKQKDWLNARQWIQKVLIVDPANRSAKRMLRKVDNKLIQMQTDLKEKQKETVEQRDGAIGEAVQEAARALEIELVKTKQDDIDIDARVDEFLQKADKLISQDDDYEGALVVLNRAFALNPADKRITKRIKEVRQQKDRNRSQLKEAEMVEIDDKKIKGDHVSSTKAEDVISVRSTKTLKDQDREDEAKAKKEAEKKEAEWKEFEHSKKILESAAQKTYQKKANKYIKKTRYYIEKKKFDKAREQVEKIFMFDQNNPTAKALLQEITNYEIEHQTAIENKDSLEEQFKSGLELEKLKQKVSKQKQKEIVRPQEKSAVEDATTEKQTIRTLLKEGKSLYKKNRYYEALNKFEAVFSIDASNKTASKYIDKVKDAMQKEREAERKKAKEEQKQALNRKLDEINNEVEYLHARGKYTEAAILIEKAMLLDPGNKYFKELKSYNETGAKEQLYREKTPDASIHNLINLAIKEYIQGNYEDARKYFEKVLEIDPNDEKAQNSIKKIDEKLAKLNLSKG